MSLQSQLVFVRAFVLSILVSSFVSCAGGLDTENGNLPPASSPEEALGRLSPEHRKNFENWKASLLKSCDASEAFGLARFGGGAGSDYRGVDPSALLNRTKQSHVIKQDGEFLAFGGINSFSGVGSSKSEQTIDINGKSYKIKVETKRNGSHCEVFLYDQKVYDLIVGQSIDVLAYANAQAVTEPGSIRIEGESYPALGVAKLEGSSVATVLSGAFLNGPQANVFLSRTLGLAERDAQKYFISQSADPGSFRLKGDEKALWSNSDFSQLYGSSETLNLLLSKGEGVLPIEGSISLPQTQTDEKVLHWTGELVFERVAPEFKRNRLSVRNIQLKSITSWEEFEARQCLLHRANTLHQISLSSPSAPSGGRSGLQPSVSAVFAPCRVFNNDMNRTARNQVQAELVREMFFGVNSRRGFEYNGWDLLLTDLALDIDKQGGDVQKEIDPRGTVVIVNQLSGLIRNFKTEFDRYELFNENTKSLLLRMGFRWLFAGLDYPSDLVHRIVGAVHNTIESFPVSTGRLVGDLGFNPSGYDEVLGYAQSLSAAYKLQAQEALVLAQQVGYSDFESQVIDQILQKRVSIEDLKTWVRRLGVLKSSIANKPKLGPYKNSLVSAAIHWLKAGEVTEDGIEKVFGAINNAAEPFARSTAQLVSDLSKSLAENRSALEFCEKISEEYKQMAREVITNSLALDMAAWGTQLIDTVIQNKPSLDQMKKWRNAAMASVAFTQREHQRLAGDSEFFNESYRKDLVGTALRETWSDVEFTTLEAIASLGSFQMICDRYKGVSSIANCLGMNLFSRADKKYLDPAFESRYRALASEFVGYVRSLIASEATMLKSTILRAFFGGFTPIWSGCGKVAFESKAALLKNQITSFLGDSDQFKRWEIERAISTTLEDCR